MSAYYKRTLSVFGAKDSDFKKKVLERLELSLPSQTFAGSATVETLLPAAMGAPETMNLGDVATIKVLYVEYTGENLTITLTDSNGASTLSLSSSGERVLMMEGLSVTQVDAQNTDASTAAPFHIAVFGDL